MESSYPSRVVPNPFGQALVAAQNVPAGVVVAKFEGPHVAAAEVPPSEICYALWLAGDDWLIPTSSARYANHSCRANCRVNDDLEVVTVRAACAGEELTISYNTVYPGEVPPPWDARWNFRCLCGAEACQGFVSGWVYQREAVAH
jgi:hypothetical protein